MINIGTQVNPYGKVVAVGSISGERYYWLIGKDKSVSMMPADVIEATKKGSHEHARRTIRKRS